MRYLTLLLILLPLLVFSQFQLPKPIDFEFVDQKQNAVPKNERLELGITFPDSVLLSIHTYLNGTPHQRKGLNPFVSWDIDVKAHFKNAKENIHFTAIGFWFTEIERNYRENKWNQLPTDLPFRIRYAPPSTGEWEVFITVSIKGQLAYVSEEKKFTVVDSSSKGFVSLNDSTQYFERDGKTIVPTGVNLPYPYNQNNLLYSLDSEETLDLAAWQSYSQLVQDYVSEGGSFFRMLMHPSVLDIEFEEVGYYQDRQYQAYEMDQLLSFCEENNALILFNLMYHSYFMKLGDYHQYRFDYTKNWHDSAVWPYKDVNLPSGYSKLLNSKIPSDMFLAQEGMRYLKERTRYILARWGYSTSISAIELLCEPWHIDENAYEDEVPYDELSKEGDTARKAVYEYHKQISSYIKDTLSYNQHLLGAVGRFPVGKTAIYAHYTEETPSFVDSTWYLENIDFISISYYAASPTKLIHSKSNNNNECGEGENSMACTIERLRKTYHKPLIFGESDHGDGTHVCSDFQGHQIDVMRYPFSGAIGHYLWAAFAHPKEGEEKNNPLDARVSWPGIIVAKDYYNSNWFTDLVSNKGALGREKRRFKPLKNDVVEQQYIIDKTKESAAGYVYNRTFNLSTASGRSLEELGNTQCGIVNPSYQVPVDISWRPQRIKVEGLQAFTKYQVSFYGYVNQSLLLKTELRSSLFGKLKLKHPLLVPKKEGTPLLWYRIEKVD